MIQRIQSFLLVLAACGIALMFMFPTATFTVTDLGTNTQFGSDLGLVAKHSVMSENTTAYGFSYLGQNDVPKKGLWIMPVLACIIGAIALVTIFLYKNRMLQMRFVAVAFFINVVYLCLVFLWYVDGFGKAIATMGYGVSSPHWSVGTWTPFVTLILLFFAQRGIKRDELKVRAADRLR